MSTLGQPNRFLNYINAFWTGNEMLIVGQTFTTEALTVGARYNPATDVWTPINSAGPKYSGQVAPVWTGSELLLFADIQSNESGIVTGGGRYNPSTDTWTPISIVGAPQRTREINTDDLQLSVWTGAEMIVLNAEYGQDPWYTSTGAYDPATDTWRPVRMSGAPKPECGRNTKLIWTGKDVILWAGCRSAGRYDPVTDTWRSMNTSTPAALREGGEVVVWTGTEMITWGRSSGDFFPNAGARYNPVTDTWTPMSFLGVPGPGDYVGAWTGQQLVVVGTEGSVFANPPPASGLYCDLVGFVPPCSYLLSPAQTKFNATGGSGSLALTTESQCKWSARTNASWVTLTSITSGSGNASLNYTVNPFAEPSPSVREARISVADVSVSIVQTAPPSISSVVANGKNLVVTGDNFDAGATILVDGVPQDTRSDTTTRSLTAKKAAKRIKSGRTASIQVQNSDGVLSLPVQFTR